MFLASLDSARLMHLLGKSGNEVKSSRLGLVSSPAVG